MSVSTPSLTVNKPTKGEELFLVHLKREEKLKIVHPEVDDHDHEPRRDRSRSIGEELFSFHLRRSHGLNLDLDELLAEATLAADADLKVASDSENAASEADQHSLHKKNTKKSLTRKTKQPAAPKKQVPLAYANNKGGYLLRKKVSPTSLH
jgi:hypothetical protein